MDFKEYNEIRERMEKYEGVRKKIDNIMQFKKVIEPHTGAPCIFSIRGSLQEAQIPMSIRKELTDVVLAFLDGKIENFEKMLEEI